MLIMSPLLIGVIVLVVLLDAAFTLWLLLPAIRISRSGLPVTVGDAIGMRLRRVNIATVLGALRLAQEAQVEVPLPEIERAALRGVDPEKAMRAFIEARRRGMGASFDDVVRLEAERAGNRVGP